MNNCKVISYKPQRRAFETLYMQAHFEQYQKVDSKAKQHTTYNIEGRWRVSSRPIQFKLQVLWMGTPGNLHW